MNSNGALLERFYERIAHRIGPPCEEEWDHDQPIPFPEDMQQAAIAVLAQKGKPTLPQVAPFVNCLWHCYF